jgi:hypothetical protein
MSGFQIVLVVIGILAACAVLALWMRRMMRQLTALWAPNTLFLKGTFSRFQTRLRGTYQDRPVLVYMGNDGSSEDVGPTTFSYTMRMTVPPGFENWALTNRVPRKGEPPAWNLKANAGPAEQLKTAGLLAAVESVPGHWQLRYRAGSGRLELVIAGVSTYFCPDPATFQAQLDLLVRLAFITVAAAGTPLLQAA